MADFGFNPSIILSNLIPQPREESPQETLRNLSDLATARNQRQLQQTSLADMLYKQGRERSLADLVSQNAGAYTDPLAQAYARGGFGTEAQDAQQQSFLRQQQAANLLKIHADILRSQASTIKTPEQASVFIGRLPPEIRSMYGFPADEKDPGALDAVKGFIASGITPEKQAQLEIDARKASKGYGFSPADPISGTIFKMDKNTGQTSVVGGGGAGVRAPDVPLKPREVNEEFGKLTDSLSDNNTRKLLGQNAQSLQRAQGIEALLHVPDLNKITPQQLREAGTALAGLIAKGGPQAVSQIDELVPESKAAEWANLKQKFLNEPEGANAKKFLQNMLETVAREKKVTLDQQRAIREEALGNYAYLRGINKNRYDSILKRVGLNPDAYDRFGNPLTGRAAVVGHYKGQLQPGERLFMNSAGQAKAVEPGEEPPEGFEEVE